jgi:hypothetical protein
MKLKGILVFAAGFITAGLLVLWAVATKRIEACRILDLTTGFDAQQTKDMEEVAGGWIHHARHCVVGRYGFDVPTTPESHNILMGQDGRAMFFASKDGVTVLDHDHVIYEWNRAKNFMAVDAYDSAQRAWIENLDTRADGTIDVRMTNFTDARPQKVEIQVGDRWLEIVKRNGRKGTILDGQFMSVDEARGKLTKSTQAIVLPQ